MATTIKIEAKPAAGTVTQQEVVAKPTLTNYATSTNPTPTLVTANTTDVSLTITSTGLDEKAVPTTIRSRSESDFINISESVIRQVTYRRTFIDPITITDAFSRIVNFKRTISETVRVAQELVTLRASILKTDRVNVSETATKSIKPVRTDQINISESILKSAKVTLADNINVLENIRLTPKPLKTDQITATDAFVRYLSWYRTFTETVNTTDDYLGNANIDDDQYATFGKRIFDIINLTESTSKQIKTAIFDLINNIGDLRFIRIDSLKTDSINSTDQFSRIAAYKRTQPDQINVSETALKSIKPSLTDNSTVTETKFLSIQLAKLDYVGYTTETVEKAIKPKYLDITNVSEIIGKKFTSGSISDSVQLIDTTLKSPKILISDSFTSTDAFTRLIQYSRVLTDQVTATDDYLGLANIDDDEYVTFGKGTLDTINVLESILKNINKPLATETVNVLETKYLNIKLLKTDNSNVSDQNTKYVQKTPSLVVNVSEITYKNINSTLTTETVNFADSVQKRANLLKTDSSQTTDSLTRVVNYLRTLLDTINTTDDYLGNANIDDDQYLNFGKTIIDTVNFTESLSKRTSKTTTDQINFTDIIIANKYASISPIDLFNVTDTPFKTIKPLITDLANITDIFSRVANYLRTFEEPISGDYIVLENLSDYLLLETGDFLTTETYTPYILLNDYIRFNASILKTDISNVIDSPLKRVSKPAADTANTTDSFARVVNYLRTLVDQINTTDDYLGNANVDDDQYVAFGKRIIDVVNIGESINKNVSKILQDITNASDQQYLNPKTVRTDQTNFTDIVTTFKYRNQFGLDQVNISSSGTAYGQNYFADPKYTTPGYTGTITTFT